ncbi:MAG: ABC transporter permease, partial [Dehalococcoidia bacterium]|nr:ABC transporter permease [Dehalococcoidia bacterium]
MTAFLVRRLIQSIIVLFGVSTVLFFLIRLSGDPVDLLAGVNAPPEVKRTIRQSLGLEDPLALQYARFLGDMVRLDFGRSITSRRPALDEVLEVLPNTLLLAVSAMVVGLMVAIPLGVFAALNRRNIGGFLVMALAVLGQSVPSFFLAVLLILFFSVQLRLLPSFGTGTLQHMVL